MQALAKVSLEEIESVFKPEPESTPKSKPENKY